MLQIGTLATAQANRRHHRLANGAGYWRSDFIPSDARGAAAGAPSPWQPQAFLVEQDADSEILPHYHEENEFQVVVNGGGSFGRHEVAPVTVHYAGRHTGYGPIRSGPGGLWYFSLRARTDPGARFLPEWRDRMERGPKRHILADPVPDSTAACTPVIDPQPDGVAAWVLRCAPGGRADPPTPPSGAARYYLVMEGSLAWNGAPLPRLSAAFASGQPFLPIAAAGGARLLVLQFPC